uniref:Uncharacterized protein n=1 Tax=Physcomitrium patens TaxID=3218 RepID=A9SG34_PHYPA|nr:hypothetical protein PHYPA_010364 [Physcomitrium patens]
MRREGRVRGKPTSRSRVTGRCRAGKTRCRSCREAPVEKSLPNRRGKCKRFAVDVFVNPNLADFEVNSLEESVCLPRAYDELFLLAHELSYSCDADDDDAVPLGVFVATVNSLLEAAVAETQGSHGDGGEVGEVVDMTCGDELASDDAVHSGDGAVQMLELAFAAAARCSPIATTNTWSDGSWSDIELSEPESSVEDDWSMVDEDDV